MYTVRELKELLRLMDDDALVFARDRDAISLRVIDVVKHPDLPLSNSSTQRINNHNSIDTVSGGEAWLKKLGDRQAIIFCDND